MSTPGSHDPYTAGMKTPPKWLSSKEGISFSPFIDELDLLNKAVREKLAKIKDKKDEMSIGDMFDMQITMNKLTQFSELSTSVVAAMNGAAINISKNIR